MNELRVGDGAGEVSPTRLAELLIEFERSLTADRPDVVVLGDDSDTALAAGLVASKLLVPLRIGDGAGQPTSVNGRLLAQLATPAPGAK